MKQEERNEILLREISSRLPYGVLVKTEDDYITTVDSIIIERPIINIGVQINGACEDYPIEEIMPYLRPMSSMTEEEKIEVLRCTASSIDKVIDFYNSHHLDYRGLIPKKLAIEAEEGMYKF